MTHDVVDPMPPAAPGEPPSPKPMRKVRSLVGWMPQQEAIQHVLGHAPTSPVEEATAIAVAEPRRAAVAARTAVTLDNPIVANADPTPLREASERPEVRATFGVQYAGIEWVDLTKLISIQKVIFTDGEARAEAAVRDGGPDALVELCLPLNPELSQLAFTPDADWRGAILVSENPNLRFQGTVLGEIDVSQGVGNPKPMKAVSFLYGMGSPYLSVAHYQGRFYLQNGYHRAAGLLRLGTNVVPAVMVNLHSYDDLAAPGSGLFGHGVVSGAVPPMVRDFWDDTVGVETSHPLSRKVLRIRGDEFNVSV